MSKRGDYELLCDIIEAIKRIKRYLNKIDFAKFQKDAKTQDAVVRNLEIIGEAVKNISAEIKKKYPQIPWRRIAGMRDRLIHHYFGVNLDIVWNIANDELPGLLLSVIKITRKM